MSQKPENPEVIIGGDEPRRDDGAKARLATHVSEDRRAKIDAAAQDFMNRNTKLLEKLASINDQN